MTEEDRKGIAWECRKNIMSALRDVDDMDMNYSQVSRHGFA